MQHNRPAAGRLLGALAPGERKLEGKSFYLDEVKRRLAAVLDETISELGGKVERFFNKDVSFVVTESPDGLRNRITEAICGGSDGMTKEASHPIKHRNGAISNATWRRPDTRRQMVYGSRGKALLEKAIRNNERRLGSTILANARSWGVKIVHVDELLPYVQWLRAENPLKHKTYQPNNARKHSIAHVVKAAALRSPYLKIEDSSRKYKPLHMQAMTFPTLCYSGRFSPFEPALPPRLGQMKEKVSNKPRDKMVDTSPEEPPTPVGLRPSPCWARKKNVGYCECCHQPFKDQEEHLQTEQHRSFVLESSIYDVVDQLVTDLQPGFDPNPVQDPTPALLRCPSPSVVQAFSPRGLERLADMETEQAIEALLTQDSVSSLVGQLLKPPSRPSTPNPASPPADMQTLPKPRHVAQLDEQPCAMCPDSLPQPLSLYPQPPVLRHCMDFSDTPSSPHSEPPVLELQVLPAPLCPVPPPQEEQEGTQSSESEPTELQLIPHTVPSVKLQWPLVMANGGADSVGAVSEALPETLVAELSRLQCGSHGNSEYAGRPCSLPRLGSTSPNTRKCCRPASPQHNAPKRRRTYSASVQMPEYISGYRTRWVSQEKTPSAQSTNSEAELMPKTSDWQTEQHPAGVYRPVDPLSMVEQLEVNRSPILTAHTHESTYLWHTLTLPGCQTTVPHSQTTPSFNVEELPSEHQTFAKFLLPSVDNIPQSAKTTPSSEMFGSTPVLSLRKKTCCTHSNLDSAPSLSSVYIESVLVPDMATLSPSSSDLDWDCHLLCQQSPIPAVPLQRAQGHCELDLELLQKPCTWTHNTSYESHLYSVLQPPTPAASLCGEETQLSPFARALIQSVEVQH